MSFFDPNTMTDYPLAGPSTSYSHPGPSTTTSTSTPRLRGGSRKSRRTNPTSSGPHGTRMKTRSSRTSPLTDLERLKAEELSLKNEINRLGLALRDVDGDGNCLFRALSDQLYGEEKRHPEIRKLVCDWLETHRGVMEPWVMWSGAGEGESYDDYVERMRKPGQYASEVEVNASARMLKRDIRIVHADHSETIPCEMESPSYAPTPQPEPVEPPPLPTTTGPTPSTPSQPRRRTRSSTTSLLSTPAAPPPSSPLYASALAEYLPPIKHGKTMLWLALFNDAEHYQSVRRKGDHERGPAEVEDRLAIPHQKDQSEAAKIARGEISAPPGSSKSSNNLHSENLDRVVESLPPGNHLTREYIAGVLARFKGDVGEAVEVLLEEVNGLLEDEDMDNYNDNETGSSDQHVEELLEPSTSRRESFSSPDPIDSIEPSSNNTNTNTIDIESYTSTPGQSTPYSPSGSATTTRSDGSKRSIGTTGTTMSGHSIGHRSDTSHSHPQRYRRTTTKPYSRKPSPLSPKKSTSTSTAKPKHKHRRDTNERRGEDNLDLGLESLKVRSGRATPRESEVEHGHSHSHSHSHTSIHNQEVQAN